MVEEGGSSVVDFVEGSVISCLWVNRLQSGARLMRGAVVEVTAAGGIGATKRWRRRAAVQTARWHKLPGDSQPNILNPRDKRSAPFLIEIGRRIEEFRHECCRDWGRMDYRIRAAAWV